MNNVGNKRIVFRKIGKAMRDVTKRNLRCYFSFSIFVIIYIVCYPAFSNKLHAFVENWVAPWNFDLVAILLPILFVIFLVVRICKMIQSCNTTSVYLRCWICSFIAIGCYHYCWEKDFIFEGWQYNGVTIPYLIVILALFGVYIITDAIAIVYRIVFLYREQTKSDDVLLQKDEAITEVEQDELGYEDKANQLLKQLLLIDVHQQSYSVGIVGTWGVGKSSFINLLKKYVQNSSNLIVDFHPRAARSVEQIQEEFFRAFASSVGMRHHGLNHMIYKYAESLQTMEYVGWLFGLFIKHRELYAAKEKQQINELLSSLGVRVFVFVEDLDRLTRDELIEVLKVIDSNGDFCQTIFVTAYDKIYVNSVLDTKWNQNRACYTDKYFQYEYQLIKPSADVRIVYLNNLFQWALEQSDASLHSRMRNEWPSISRILLEELINIRHVKRFTSQLKMAYFHQQGEVVFEDYCLIMLVKYLDVPAYEAISEMEFTQYREFLTGEIRLKDDYLEICKRYPYVKNLNRILNILFLTKNEASESSNDYNRIRRTNSFYNYFYEKRIGHISYQELNALFELKQEEALAALDDLYASGDVRSIEEFLITRQPEWIATQRRLGRYVVLLVATYSHLQSINIWHALSIRFLKEVFFDYQKAGIVQSEQKYMKVLQNVFYTLIPLYPQVVGGFFISRINSRVEDTSMEERFLDSLEQCRDFALRALLEYDKKIDSEDWNSVISFELAKISISKGVWYDKSLAHLRKMMSQYASRYTPGIFIFQEVDAGKAVTMTYRDSAWLHALYPNEWEYYQWIRNINDAAWSYICRVYFEWNVSIEDSKPMRLQLTMQQVADNVAIYEELKRTYKNEGKPHALLCRYMDAIYDVAQSETSLKSPIKKLMHNPVTVYDNPKSCTFLLMDLYSMAFDKEKMKGQKMTLDNMTDTKSSHYWSQKREMLGNLLPQVAYLDMFPINVGNMNAIESLPIVIRRELLKVTHAEIVRLAPRIIIYANASTFYYWGKDDKHPWMGYELENVSYKFKSIVLPKRCQIYKIIGLQNTDKCIVRIGMPNLIGTYIIQYGYEQYKKRTDRLTEEHLKKIYSIISSWE